MLGEQNWEMLSEGLLQRCKGQFGTGTLPSGSSFPFIAIEELRAASHPCAPLPQQAFPLRPPLSCAGVAMPGSIRQGEKSPWFKKKGLHRGFFFWK